MKPSQGPQMFFKNVKTSRELQIMKPSQGPPTVIFLKKVEPSQGYLPSFFKEVKPSWGSRLSFFKNVKPSQRPRLPFSFKNENTSQGPQKFRLSFFKDGSTFSGASIVLF